MLTSGTMVITLWVAPFFFPLLFIFQYVKDTGLVEMGPGSSTLHVLGLGEHELEAVLLVDTFGPSCTAQLSG